jgi:hypothetical protein
MSHGYSRFFPPFLDHESSTSRSRKPDTGPQPEPDESSPQHSHPIRHTSVLIRIALLKNLFSHGSLKKLFNPLKTPVKSHLALLGAHHILHVSRIRVNKDMEKR